MFSAHYLWNTVQNMAIISTRCGYTTKDDFCLNSPWKKEREQHGV